MSYSKIGFVHDIKQAAIDSCKDTGLFPSVIIAQACLESDFGLSGLSLNCNNFFGIKKPANWEGDIRSYNTTEYVKGKKITVKADFCRFKDFEDCLEYHNAMLKRVPVYARCGLFHCLTPESQAQTLRIAGYATDPNYAKSLINLIKEYNLKQYDLK